MSFRTDYALKTGTPDLLPDAILIGEFARVGDGTVANVKLRLR